MSSDPPSKPHERQAGMKVDLDPLRFPMPWTRVEEFLRDYARDLARVGEANTVAAKSAGRGGVELRGPVVFLELAGEDRRLGVVASGARAVVIPVSRQRLLVLEPGEDGARARLIRITDLGPEATEWAFDLPPGCGEWSRLQNAIKGSLEGERNPHPAPGGWEEAAERLSLALGLLLAVARAGRRVVLEATNRSTRGLRQFERFLDLLRERYREQLPLPAVAESIGLSPRQFARLLNQWSGTGFTEHLLMVRLMAARLQLVQSGATIEEIAASTGFGSRDHFIRAFRQYFGWTPLQYRKSWRAASEGREKWESILQMPGRNPVEWLPAGTIGRSPEEEAGNFHSMVVANATNQVRVLHRITADGAAIPEGALQPGETLFLHRAINQGFWRVGNALAVPTAAFRSPGPRALAMISD